MWAELHQNKVSNLQAVLTDVSVVDKTTDTFLYNANYVVQIIMKLIQHLFKPENWTL